LIEARLQAVSSRNMYSEQGLEALISPPAGQVCHSLTVPWNWMPGSAHFHAALPILSQSSRAGRVFMVLPEMRPTRFQSPPFSTASMKRLSSRTELFEACPATVL